MGPQRVRATTGGVDFYVGGVEHAVLHLLYARFWHKVLFDLGHVSSEEPFHRLFNQGYIQAYAFTDERGSYVPAEQVVEKVEGTETSYLYDGGPVTREYGKMGKSLKNVVSPDDMYDAYGADTFRVYEMSMGPLDLSRPWETRAVVGSLRFLQRLWRNVVDEETGEPVVADDRSRRTRPAARCTGRSTRVRTDMTALRFNTAIAEADRAEQPPDQARRRARARSPRRWCCWWRRSLRTWPRSCGRDWDTTGRWRTSRIPTADPALLVEETVTCVVQVDGKVRDRLEVPVSVDEDTLETLALASPAVQRVLGGRGGPNGRGSSTGAGERRLRMTATAPGSLPAMGRDVAIVTDSTAYLPPKSAAAAGVCGRTATGRRRRPFP